MLAPRLDLRGRVLDGAGRPLAEVLVQVTVELAGRADLDLVALLPDRFEARARSAADGSFEIPGVPDLEHGRVLLRQGEGAPTLLGLPELRAGGDVLLPGD